MKKCKPEEGFSSNEEIDLFIKDLNERKSYLLEILNDSEKGYSYSVSEFIITFFKQKNQIGEVSLKKKSQYNKYPSAFSHSFDGNDSKISFLYDKLKKSFNIKETYG